MNDLRKCRNWQTSKTKDLVSIALVWVQVPSSAFFIHKIGCGNVLLIRMTDMQEWRNWQTRRLQVPVVAISCGFKSHLLH